MEPARMDKLVADIQDYLREEEKRKVALKQLQNKTTEDLSEQKNSTDWVSLIMKCIGFALTTLSVGYVYLVWYAIKYLESWISNLAVGTFALVAAALISGIVFQIQRLRLLSKLEANTRSLLEQKNIINK